MPGRLGSLGPQGDIHITVSHLGNGLVGPKTTSIRDSSTFVSEVIPVVTQKMT